MFRILFLSVLLFLSACSENEIVERKEAEDNKDPRSIITEDYELVIPNKQETLLILFPCFPCDAKNTKEEFNILETALKNNTAVLFMNFNQHLWLSENEKIELERIIMEGVAENNINADNTFIGGFSGGGNVSLLLTDYLKSTESTIQPKGLFIVDSPIDLLGLYVEAQKVIEKDFSPVAVEEAKWIVDSFDTEFGIGDTSLTHYENKSPYISKTHSIKNLSHLDEVKIRLYSEPDTLWWRENRQTEYQDLNSYDLEHLAIDLKKKYGENSVVYIQTKNRGYRSNGDRHPHSWAIVDEKELIAWINLIQK